MTQTLTPREFDVAIAGGGLVGASLALALAPLGLRIALVEAVASGSVEHPSFDERTTALANGTVRVFRSLDVWRHMQREATAIRRIHVSEQGRFGVARIDAAEQGLDALGYVLPNRVIGAALWEGLRRVSGVETFAPARVTGTGLANERRTLGIETRRGGFRYRGQAGRRRGRCAFHHPRAGWRGGRALGVRPDCDHRHADDAALPRPRGLRAFHSGWPDRRTAAGRRAVRHRVDAPSRGSCATARAARRGVPRRPAGRLRLPPRQAAARRHPVFLSARAVALGASRGAAARHRRQCRTVAASHRGTGLQSGAARRGEPRGSDRGRAGGRPDRRRRRGHAARLRQLA